MNKIKLGEITKGDWYIKSEESKIRSTLHIEGKSICLVYPNKEIESNIELIIDAGNTAQKCGKLPSELLAENKELRDQRDKALGALEQAAKIINYDR